MSNLFQTIISFLLVFPIVIFIVVFFVSSKISRKTTKAFGHAADITTLVLFFAVPIAIQSLFQIETVGFLIGIALIISVILTFLEWKSKKEIELLSLVRKIWRFLFLILSVTYFVVWCLGFVFKVIEFVN
jgi:hypothetical protein